jgi:hypothetical protein
MAGTQIAALQDATSSLCSSLQGAVLNATILTAIAFVVFSALSFFIYTRKYSKSKSPAWLVALILCLLMAIGTGLTGLGMVASFIFYPATC